MHNFYPLAWLWPLAVAWLRWLPWDLVAFRARKQWSQHLLVPSRLNCTPPAPFQLSYHSPLLQVRPPSRPDTYTPSPSPQKLVQDDAQGFSCRVSFASLPRACWHLSRLHCCLERGIIRLQAAPVAVMGLGVGVLARGKRGELESREQRGVPRSRALSLSLSHLPRPTQAFPAASRPLG